MIAVIYRNGSRGLVSSAELGRLIDSGDVRSFWRAGGWVTPGRDPIRANRRPGLCIPERREDALRDFDDYLKNLQSGRVDKLH